MTDYHEAWEALPKQNRDLHRALASFKEEIEAIDWYQQRVAVASDPELAAVLAHNRDEEIEHACMTLEWLRRRMPGWEENLRTYLFADDPITAAEESARGDADAEQVTAGGTVAASRSPVADLGIGTLKGGI